MKEKPASCGGCPLYGTGRGYVPATGPGANGILLVGEAAGETEERFGVPFVGAAGFYLDRLLKRAGLDRGMFRIHNVLSCRPPQNRLAGAGYEGEAIARCAPNLDATIRAARPRVIVALGNIPLRRLTGFDGIKRYRGWVLPGPEGSWVVPTFHPSFLLPRKGQANTSRFVGAVLYDLKKAEWVARHGFRREAGVYWCDPAPDQAALFVLEYEEALRADPQVYLSVDIETPYKLKTGDEEELGQEEGEEEEEVGETRPKEDPILRISFAFRPRYAMSVPWAEPWMGVIRRLLGGVGRKIFWNGLAFDVPVLREHGMEVGGELHDFMWGWHLRQSDLPRGLESVASYFAHHLLPWKHENHALPAWYNAVDADAALCNGLGIEQELKANGQWELYRQHVVSLGPILYTVGRVHGVGIDRDGQQRLRETLERERDRLVGAAQQCVPDGLRPRRTFARERPGSVRVSAPVTVRVCSACGKENVNRKHPCLRTGGTIEHRSRDGVKWEIVGEFNPNSLPQLTAYAEHFRHPLGVHVKTKRPTLDKKHLEKLKRRFGEQHPIYGIAMGLREVKKTLGTYVVGMVPDGRGRIYTTYTFAPSTGRLASQNKNLQNISHRGTLKYAKEVRRTIVPTVPGWVFVEADSSAIEAVFTGHFMGSAEYTQLAKEGIHDYLTFVELGIPWNPEEIEARKLDPDYKERRERNKRVVHGTNYGMGPRLMTILWPEIFPREREAKAAQERYFQACRGLAEWHHRVRSQAHKESYLVNPWGYRHYYYHVFQKDRDGQITLGSDGNRCVSFLPQGSGGAFMKDNAILMWEQIPEKRWIPANWLVHDSYCLQVPPDRVEWAIEFLVGILTRPIPQLGGIRVGCEVKVGPNWADMTAVRKVTV